MSEGQKFSKEYTQKKFWIEKEQKMTVWIVKKKSTAAYIVEITIKWQECILIYNDFELQNWNGWDIRFSIFIVWYFYIAAIQVAWWAKMTLGQKMFYFSIMITEIGRNL